MATQEEFRARIQALSDMENDVYGPDTDDNPMAILHESNGVIFPFTPVINTMQFAEWQKHNLPHTNYSPSSYHHSSINEIQVDGRFIANNNENAEYAYAAIHFFRTVTKMHYGITDKKKGTPPPILRFSAYGKGMFNNIPVVVKSFTHTLPENVDYVNVPLKGGKTFARIPVDFNISVILVHQPNMVKVRSEFSLDKFRKGDFLTKDSDGYI